ncbi:MAG: TraY domain-containing protein [Clostridiales bacterium]|nr:TraY domain-containing protein [Clostridiales bacterium]
MTEGTKKRISILIPAELYQELSKQAERSSRSLSSYIRQALKWHLWYLDQFPRQ